ncbi:MAG: RDD family protein [Desulfuromonadales bacterium]
MKIICPKCNFSRTVDPASVPDRPVKVNCPRCGNGFIFDKSLRSRHEADPGQVSEPSEQITCPVCSLLQDKSDTCKGCGVVYAMLLGQWQKNGQSPQNSDILNSSLAELRRKAERPAPQDQPKAGFWLRVIACMLDFFLLGMVQGLLSLLINLVIGMLGIATEDDPAVGLVLMLFGVSLIIGYVVFFTGYCGQTPGKMALRIKVIRIDGSPVSYSRAFLREVPGKFISIILLGIGYLMVAFDSQKQGLHDKIADSYVIKL